MVKEQEDYARGVLEIEESALNVTETKPANEPA